MAKKNIKINPEDIPTNDENILHGTEENVASDVSQDDVDYQAQGRIFIVDVNLLHNGHLFKESELFEENVIDPVSLKHLIDNKIVRELE